jgi:hypothetical protein
MISLMSVVASGDILWSKNERSFSRGGRFENLDWHSRRFNSASQCATIIANYSRSIYYYGNQQLFRVARKSQSSVIYHQSINLYPWF